MDDVAELRRKVQRARWGLAALLVPVGALLLFSASMSIENHFHGRFVVSHGTRWCALRPGVASPATANSAMGLPSSSGVDSTSGQSWSQWRFHGVEYDISWFPGNERAQDLWSSVTAQWGTLPCAKERIDYSGWYQPAHPWQDPPDPGAFQP